MLINGSPRQYRDAVAYEYQHSLPVDPALYDNDDFLFNIRPRVNFCANASDAACFEVRDDWMAATGREHKGAGCMDPVGGNFAALCFPEATEERLYALAFVNEFIFIQDDYVDATETTEMDNTVDQFSWNDDKKSSFAKSKDEIHRSIKAVQAKVLAQLLQDKVAGGFVIDEIKKFTGEQAFTRRFDFKNGNIDEYIEFRHRDIGTYFISACTGFGVVPTISPSEVESILDTTKIGYACAMLCNDYWSWDKEFEDFTGEGNWPVNAVYLFMQQQNVDAKTAKEMVKVKTMDLAKQYGEKAVKCLEGLPSDSPVVRWFGLLDLVIAGNALWSITCPRYHREKPQLCKDQISVGQSNGNNKVLPFRDAASRLTPPPEEGFKHETDLASQDNLRFQDIYEKITMEPYDYVASLPAKGLRDHLLEALNVWFGLNERALSTIKDIINTLHNVSLMLDDIEDNTFERRGHPATHLIFGTAQTINSAGYAQMICLNKVMSLGSRGCLDAYVEEAKAIYIGQGLDLHWTYHSQAPTEEEYFDSVDRKTGGLLQLMAKLIQACSIDLALPNCHATSVSEDGTSARLLHLVVLIGRYYQICDDLKDIKDARSASQCDFDQGNFTLPVLHFLCQEKSQSSTRLMSMFQARKTNNGMSTAMKHCLLGLLERSGSLTYTSQILEQLHEEIMTVLLEVEVAYGAENRALRKLLERLKL